MKKSYTVMIATPEWGHEFSTAYQMFRIEQEAINRAAKLLKDGADVWIDVTKPTDFGWKDDYHINRAEIEAKS